MSNRTNRFKVSCTDSEDERLEKLAEQAGIPKAKYVREVALGERAPLTLEGEEQKQGSGLTEGTIKEMLKELSAQGQNLNQIAKKIHTLGAVDVVRFDECIDRADRVYKELLKLAMS